MLETANVDIQELQGAARFVSIVENAVNEFRGETRAQIQEEVWSVVMSRYWHLYLPRGRVRFNRAKMTASFPSGNTIKCYSLDRTKNLRGEKCTTVLFLGDGA